ncbi:MAG: aminopeptidase [Saprospiraceae bacterium]|nr:aminopeptidase [Saprospiraceae bacterium]MBK7796504.1 aminopeptidase [Saprospiraceae bacterium]MBL0260104.1 aminopeptidase [Saprospiraceae bacterium]
MNFEEKYAKLITEYSLYLRPGDHLLIRSTTLAETLVREIFRLASQKNVRVDIVWEFDQQEEILLSYADKEIIAKPDENLLDLISKCTAYLLIRAPFINRNRFVADAEKLKLRTQASAEFSKIYFQRLGNGSLKRSLCQYPTEAGANFAEMSLEDYKNFIIHACYLDKDEPSDHWKKLSHMQQGIVDYLNSSKWISYIHGKHQLTARVEGRTWINSDGKSNMPSGEVFTSPIEDQVNGEIYFDFPTMMMGQDVHGIYLKVKDGWIEEFKADQGQDVLEKVFAIEGTRRFGEIAIGTNYNITRTTRNILFDEKIGGSVHMAVGQSYLQCGGKNQSSIHWDLIKNMRDGGKIIVDDKLIYENGEFLI